MGKKEAALSGFRMGKSCRLFQGFQGERTLGGGKEKTVLNDQLNTKGGGGEKNICLKREGGKMAGFCKNMMIEKRNSGRKG